MDTQKYRSRHHIVFHLLPRYKEAVRISQLVGSLVKEKTECMLN